MAQSAPTSGTSHSRATDSRGGNPWAAGGTMFAGILLMVDGVLDILKGIAGIVSNDVYARINDYVFKFNVTAWGWVHVGLGIILVLVGWGILRGVGLARGIGVGLAALNMIANFMWLPYQPIWAVISLAIDTFVIWALCTDRSKALI
ncbi:DUF7144 family membrane protein [Streptomyces brevispora]|uniref:DUF7144 domain-containing protein n=1 Tax=Streptomyces brevispora TaxID=887462 RepID=A0A561UTY6_9ACTN|nr:hypothetical protein [Streptomyces brevispora]TWG02833.1 hypothetical protein FHX80_111244 [Streptomyces brevispora]WSC16055.1 hypothetical protein OIE64_26665 [Streptomyces brevispora]